MYIRALDECTIYDSFIETLQSLADLINVSWQHCVSRKNFGMTLQTWKYLRTRAPNSHLSQPGRSNNLVLGQRTSKEQYQTLRSVNLLKTNVVYAGIYGKGTTSSTLPCKTGQHKIYKVVK